MSRLTDAYFRASACPERDIRVLLKLQGVTLSIAAEVVRTERQNAQVTIAFRDLPREALETIERAIEAMIARVRAASPPTALVLGAPAETRAALERDLAHLGRRARPCTTMLEAMWSLQIPRPATRQPSSP